MQHSRDTAIAVSDLLQPVRAPTETRHRMTTGGIPEDPIGHVTEQNPAGSPPAAPNHSGTAIPT